MNAAMLTLGDLAADGLAVVNLAAVGAEVEPARIGILRHHAVGGTDEARLVQLVVSRHGKLQHVDVVAFDHVLEHGAVVHEARRQRLEILRARMIGPHDVHLALVFERQPQRQGDAADGGKLPIERAEAFGIARHIVEQDRRRAAPAFFREHMRDGTHLHVPMGAIDPAQLSQLVDVIEPTAQSAVMHPRFR